MISYLKDTNAVEVYNGSAWVSSDDPNAIQNTIVDAKGDLITATAADTPARLAVGNNGDTLLADSSTTTGLRWQGDYAAGKNKIINGDFNINQRAFTTTTSDAVFNFDRFYHRGSGGTCTVSAETFTLGTAPVTGYEGKNFIRLVSSGQSGSTDQLALEQRIESVRTLANQVTTVSFWAKAASGTPKIAIEINQNFGTGGSPSAGVTVYFGQVTLSTSWARYSATLTVPSISGKTLGTANDNFLGLKLFCSAGSSFDARTGTLGIQNNTFDFWGVQVEAGSVATAFQTATGTLQGELAACQRYFQVIGGKTNSYPLIGGSNSAGAGTERRATPFPVQMRTTPTITKNGTWEVANCGQPSSNYISEQGFSIETAVTGAGAWYFHPNGTDDSFTISAEL
jgi:hypothetical protein